VPDQSTPTARDLYDAMRALNKRKITPDEFRAIMRQSREAHGEDEHQRLKNIALANFG
jgi:disulfide oxidoreductase YuzD